MKLVGYIQMGSVRPCVRSFVRACVRPALPFPKHSSKTVEDISIKLGTQIKQEA